MEASQNCYTSLSGLVKRNDTNKTLKLVFNLTNGFLVKLCLIMGMPDTYLTFIMVDNFSTDQKAIHSKGKAEP